MIKSIRTDSKNPQIVAVRRSQIARSAARLMMKNGYHRTTLRQIARASNLGLGTIYHYIGSKEDILRLIISVPDIRLRELGAQLTSDVGTMNYSRLLINAIDKYFHLIDELQDVWLFNFTESKSLPEDSLQAAMQSYLYFIEIFQNIIVQGCKAKEFRTDNPRLIGQNIITMGNAWAHARWFLRTEYTISEYIKEQSNLVMTWINSEERF